MPCVNDIKASSNVEKDDGDHDDADDNTIAYDEDEDASDVW